MKAVLMIFLALHFNFEVKSQIVNLQLKPGPIQGKDAYLASWGSGLNFGNHQELSGAGWTCNGNPCIGRGLISFDLTSIPAGSLIQNAYLNLYANPLPLNGNGVAMQGSNDAFIYRVTSPWVESSVTYSSQPSYSVSNCVYLPTSTSAFQNYMNINVTAMVSDMVTMPATSYGFLLKLSNEAPYSTMIFASSDFTDPMLWPELSISYIPPGDSCLSLSALDPFSSDAYLSSYSAAVNFGAHPELSAISWTCQGNPCFGRGLLNFDFSVIPQGALISSAQLNLYAHPNPVNGNGVAMQGNNASILQRVVFPWSESSVNWSNQPFTTTVNSVILPSSTAAFQDYLGIDVTAIVVDILSNNPTGFGFLLKLMNETGFTSMTFASSDNGNQNLAPTLEVCFTMPVGVTEMNDEEIVFAKVSPNPTLNGRINISIQLKSAGTTLFELFDIHGRSKRIWRLDLLPGVIQNFELELGTSNFTTGFYLLKIQSAVDLHVERVFIGY